MIQNEAPLSAPKQKGIAITMIEIRSPETSLSDLFVQHTLSHGNNRDFRERAYFLATANKATPNGREIFLSRASSKAMIFQKTRCVNDASAESKSRPIVDPPRVRATIASGKSNVVQ